MSHYATLPLMRDIYATCQMLMLFLPPLMAASH